jgi:hypothetical protein
MFRATVCPSSGGIPVFMRHLVLVILYGWLSGMQGGMKHTKKNCARSWLYLQDYTGMHGQQNIKFVILYGKLTAANYKNHPKYIHHHYNHRSGVRPRSVLSRLIVSSEGFPIVFVHLVHISALFLAFCCRPFLLRDVANLFCIFSVSHEPVLLTSLPEFLHVVVVKKDVPRCSP